MISLDGEITMCCGAKFGALGLLFSLLFGRGGCCPTEVPFTVTLAVAPTSIMAEGGTTTLTATLGTASAKDVQLTLDAQQTPEGNAAYQLSAATITIPSGSSQGSVTLTALALPADTATASVIVRVSKVGEGTCTWDVNVPAEPLTITAPGALQVTLTPPEAVSAGAQWNMNGGSWQDSGTTISGLAPGTYTVNYRDVQGWTAPVTEQVTVSSAQTTAITRNYALAGGLKIALGIGPQFKAFILTPLLGAQWKLDGGEYHDSNATVSGLAPGIHTVDYAPVDGWTAPPSEQVTITGGQTLSISRIYVPLG
jgi:hypothetical protein